MFATAAKLGVPIFVHPQIPQRAVRDVYYSGFGELVDTAFAIFALGWHYEAGWRSTFLLERSGTLAEGKGVVCSWQLRARDAAGLWVNGHG